MTKTSSPAWDFSARGAHRDIVDVHATIFFNQFQTCGRVYSHRRPGEPKNFFIRMAKVVGGEVHLLDVPTRDAVVFNSAGILVRKDVDGGRPRCDQGRWVRGGQGGIGRRHRFE